MSMPAIKRVKQLVIFSFCAVFLTGCAASHQYLKPEDSRKVYEKTYDEIFAAAPEAVQNAKMKLVEIRKDEGVIDVVASPSLLTSSLANLMQGGDKVTVVVRRVSESSSSIEITSVSKGDLMDFGRSSRVVTTLLKGFDKALQ